MSDTPIPVRAAVAELELPTPAADTVQVDLEARGRRYLAAAKRQAAIERFTQDCPPAYLESDWNHPGLQPYALQIRRVLSWQPSPKGLLLAGPTGRGKTRSLFALYDRLVREGAHDTRYWHANDWFSRLGEEVRFGKDDAAAWVEAVASRAIVILDDVGQEAVLNAKADWAAAHFFRFLDLRLASSLPLIATTNLGADEIASRFSPGNAVRGDPLVRRLLDLCEVVKF